MYPEPKKRRRDRLQRSNPGNASGSNAIHSQSEAWNSMSLLPWVGADPGDLDQETDHPESLSSSTSATRDSAVGTARTAPAHQLRLSHPKRVSSSWFAQPETWTIEHGIHGSEPAPASAAKEFLKGVQAMCREWVIKGSNGFIHKNLYRAGLPPCLQDAFTTLAACVARTPETEDLVLQIAENRATALLSQPLPDEDQRTETMAHLSRVQAMLVYRVIRPAGWLHPTAGIGRESHPGALFMEPGDVGIRESPLRVASHHRNRRGRKYRWIQCHRRTMAQLDTHREHPPRMAPARVYAEYIPRREEWLGRVLGRCRVHRARGSMGGGFGRELVGSLPV